MGTEYHIGDHVRVTLTGIVKFVYSSSFFHDGLRIKVDNTSQRTNLVFPEETGYQIELIEPMYEENAYYMSSTGVVYYHNGSMWRTYKGDLVYDHVPTRPLRRIVFEDKS